MVGADGKCPHCGDQGWTEVTGMEHHPRCNGSCDGRCPVPVQEQEQCQCAVEVKSPCTGCCFYDHDKNHCATCFRTLEEIGGWWLSTNKEKKEVLKQCQRRGGRAVEGTRLENERGVKASVGSNPTLSAKKGCTK